VAVDGSVDLLRIEAGDGERDGGARRESNVLHEASISSHR
jgi:hypothetical protein